MQNICQYLIESEIEYRKNTRSRFMQNQFDYANNLFSKDLKGHFSCVNAVEFSNNESQHLLSAGDDKRVLLWNINKSIFSSDETFRPLIFDAQHHSNIFSLAWDNENFKCFSGILLDFLLV
jgi:DDB1- and CUL4-associated factor 5